MPAALSRAAFRGDSEGNVRLASRRCLPLTADGPRSWADPRPSSAVRPGPSGPGRRLRAVGSLALLVLLGAPGTRVLGAGAAGAQRPVRRLQVGPDEPVVLLELAGLLDQHLLADEIEF